MLSGSALSLDHARAQMRCALFLMCIMLLIGCAATSLKGSVTRIHSLDPGPKSFVMLPQKEQDGAPEFKTCSALVADKLRALGWREATFDSADVAIFIQYESRTRRAMLNPIYESVPTGNVGMSGGMGMNSMMNNMSQPTIGRVDTGMSGHDEFDRAVRMTIFSLPIYRQSRKLESVYRGEIISTGLSDKLSAVLPALVEGLFQEFPGKSGTKQTVSIPIR